MWLTFGGLLLFVLMLCLQFPVWVIDRLRWIFGAGLVCCIDFLCGLLLGMLRVDL